MFGINFMELLTTVNTWGKEYWGAVLMLLTVSYLLTNLVRNVRGVFWAARMRRMRARNRFARMSMSRGSGFRSPFVDTPGFYPQRPQSPPVTATTMSRERLEGFERVLSDVDGD